MIRKFHPRLKEMLKDGDKKIVQLGSEQQMKEMWDASNPDIPHEMRSTAIDIDYPIDNWFGAVVNENGKARLVSVVGNSIETGKEGKPYAYFGGAKTHPDYRKGGNKNVKGGLFREVRDKALDPIRGMPRIAGFTGIRRASGINLDTPEKHEVIPDEVLDSFRQRYENSVWGISKWMEQLRI